MILSNMHFPRSILIELNSIKVQAVFIPSCKQSVVTTLIIKRSTLNCLDYKEKTRVEMLEPLGIESYC